MIKRLLLTVALVLVVSSISFSQIRSITGINVSGPKPDYPLIVSMLCDGHAGNLNCPQFFHPQWNDTSQSNLWGITNRVNPPLCVRSTDGGTVWTTCDTHPFVGAVLNFGAKFAVASDGSLLSAGGQGTDTCIIRRSTNQAVSWTTVFTSAGISCSLLFGGSAVPPGMYCAESSGYCAITLEISGVQVTMLYSLDNGATWAVGVTFPYLSADSRIWGPILHQSQIEGRISRGSNTAAGQPFGIGVSSGDYVATNNYSPPLNVNCRPLLMGSTNFRMLCTRNGVSDATLRYVNPDTVPLEIGTVSLGSILPANQNIQVLGYSSTVGYVLVVDTAATSQLKILITVDTFSSLHLIGTLTPATIPITFCCNGNTIKWGNTMYMSSGAGGSNAFLLTIR